MATFPDILNAFTITVIDSIFDNVYFWCSNAFFSPWDRVSLCSAGCPRTHSVDQVCPELRNPPASASRVLGLKACATTAQPVLFSLPTLNWIYLSHGLSVVSDKISWLPGSDWISLPWTHYVAQGDLEGWEYRGGHRAPLFLPLFRGVCLWYFAVSLLCV